MLALRSFYGIEIQVLTASDSISSSTIMLDGVAVKVVLSGETLGTKKQKQDECDQGTTGGYEKGKVETTSTQMVVHD